MKNRRINFLAAVLAFIFLSGSSAFAQNIWLDQNPLPGWNERSRAILETKKISPAELKRCAVVVRQPTLAQDRLLTKMNWTLVGAAQVYGRTTVVTTADGFDGMCRPMGIIARVFVGNLVAGTLSPAPTDSRTDGYLTGVKMTSEKNLTAEYARYGASDALCCPSKIEAVTFVVKPDAGANFLLVPESKIDTSAGNNGSSNGGGNQPGDSGERLKNTVWRWESADDASGKITIEKPENYQIEFKPDGKLLLKADCNGGGASYKADGGQIEVTKIFTTKMFCGEASLDNKFLQNLEAARTFTIEGYALTFQGKSGEKMRFFKVVRQN